MESAGKVVVLVGVIVVVVGLIIWFFGDRLGFLRKLPGDVDFRHGNVRVFIPFTTMVLLSLLLSLLAWFIRRAR